NSNSILGLLLKRLITSSHKNLRFITTMLAFKQSLLAFKSTPSLSSKSLQYVSKRHESVKTLFFKNIPNGTDPKVMRNHFEQFSKVINLRMPVMRVGKTRGFGFLEVDEENSELIFQKTKDFRFQGRKNRN
ncbi:hypothetical protein DSO57_1019998, partial [Entomophthora muscae]